MTTLPKRHGLRTVMLMAERAIHELASQNLAPLRLAQMDAAIGTGLFTAGNYPASDWERLVGFIPDRDLYYQVMVGIAADPPQPPDIFAKALIGRDTSADFCHIVWEPGGGT